MLGVDLRGRLMTFFIALFRFSEWRKHGEEKRSNEGDLVPFERKAIWVSQGPALISLIMKSYRY